MKRRGFIKSLLGVAAGALGVSAIAPKVPQPPADWQFMCVTVDCGRKTVYINGVEVIASRERHWAGITLTKEQAMEEYLTEIAVINGPTGSAAKWYDLGDRPTTMTFDGVDDYLDLNPSPFELS